ncbi:MAG: hypothetical protein NTX45_29255 [Proteobacteria bacterium]|nr:hypothetical protein [Pseudomonadota bacterium]
MTTGVKINLWNLSSRTRRTQQHIPCGASIAEIAVLGRHRTGLEGTQDTRQGYAKSDTFYHIDTLRLDYATTPRECAL